MNIVSSFFGNLGKFWQNSSNSRLLRFNIFLFILQIILILWFFNQLPPQVPLFFSQNWGSAWLTSSTYIFILPLFSLLVMLLNYFLALYFYQKKFLLSQLLVVFSFIISIFSTISLIEIIKLVT
ncbi:MAG: hypothetical protein WC784_01185 [Candidatus Shapirobacteria bacterium]|jgi:hypothetical protein